jgi:chemotaxis response regulator CheB
VTETIRSPESIIIAHPTLSNVAIAIASDSVQQRSRLRKLAEQAAMQVVLIEPLTRLFLHKLEKTNAAVMVLDLHDNIEHDEGLINELLDTVTIPIIFNDVTALTVNEPPGKDDWYHPLLRKIAESTGNENVDISLLTEKELAKKKPNANDSQQINLRHAIAKSVWVLGASLGGPDALKRFLAALPADIPAAFVVAQHLGANFVELLARQLDRVTKVEVMAARDGHVLRHNQVVIAPVMERIRINPIGNIELEMINEQTAYMPSIDRIVRDFADRYGKRAGAIIFSGMGDDGQVGCQHLQKMGGQVWVQAAETCVISSMPDNVRRNCDVAVVGSPEYLARRLASHLRTRTVEAS